MAEQQGNDPSVVWIEGMARGDRAALEALFRAHAPHLLPIGLSILKNPSDAEEVLHEVFLEAWRKARSYDPQRGSVRAWLAVRMRSRCLDRLKSETRCRHVPWDEQSPAPGDAGPAETWHDPERTVEYTRMKGALESMPEEQRQVIVLGYFEGLSSSEMAQRLRVPLGTVKSRVRMGLLRLKELLLEDETP